MSQKSLMHAQALSMQWVAFALQQMVSDIKNGGEATNQLLAGAMRKDEKDHSETVSLGCTYVTNYVLPFAIELGLKALLVKEGKGHVHKHELFVLYTHLSKQNKNELKSRLSAMIEDDESIEPFALKNFLSEHNDDFIRWRYLENVDGLSADSKKMQYVVCAILDLYNK